MLIYHMSSPGIESPLPTEKGFFVINPGEQIPNKGLCRADVQLRESKLYL